MFQRLECFIESAGQTGRNGLFEHKNRFLIQARTHPVHLSHSPDYRSRGIVSCSAGWDFGNETRI